MRTQIIVIMLLMVSCRPDEPAAPRIGQDACSHCKMILVDQKFTASLLTVKGRTYHFDAIECMVHYLDEQNLDTGLMLRVADYTGAGAITDARKACYLISDRINSPMGGNLLACAHPDSCAHLREQLGGTEYTWEELLQTLPSP